MGGTVRKVTGEKKARKQAAQAEAKAKAQIAESNEKIDKLSAQTRRKEVALAERGSAALRSRRRGYRSLLSADREDAMGIGNKLGG
jgi:septal ring factor EnvC (AmiA/AmiB activator)